jgi:hypothetical protein
VTEKYKLCICGVAIGGLLDIFYVAFVRVDEYSEDSQRYTFFIHRILEKNVH